MQYDDPRVYMNLIHETPTRLLIPFPAMISLLAPLCSLARRYGN